MTYSIKGNPDHLIARAQQLYQLAAEIERQLNTLDNSVSPLRWTFIGKRAGSFFQQYDQFKGQMYGLRDVVNGFAGQLMESGNKLKSVDRA
jgi:WXG100 family type VII secretion target